MAQYVGLDVGLEWRSICVIDQDGAVVWRGRIATEVESLAAAVRTRAPEAALVGLETGALSTWCSMACASSACRSCASTPAMPKRC
jgi:transposase